MSDYCYVVMSYPETSDYPFSRHVADECVTNIYGIYATMQQAVTTVHEIYEKQILGVKYGTEFAIIKKKIIPQEDYYDES